MSPLAHRSFVGLASAALLGAVVAAGLPGADSQPAPKPDLISGRDFPDASGAFRTVSTTGSVDLHNPFFQSLGTNGRACVTCHQPLVDWTITPASVQTVFLLTGGRDPLFRLVDGANSPDADVSTLSARRRAYSMLLTKGVIRVGLPIPPGAEFTLTVADDPYGHASAADLSLFRRPLPATNLRFLSTVMWDGRENSPGRSIPDDLLSQAADAIKGHAQATGLPTDGVLQSILDFESSLYTTQSLDGDAGWLDQSGGGGGPESLVQQEFYIGINDPFATAFDPAAFTLYQGWANADQHPPKQGFGPGGRAVAQARASVARGEQIFNTKPIAISGVGGLNDVVGSPVIRGTCTTCHDTPNVGDHSVAAPLNIGLTGPDRRTPDMPLYTLVNTNHASPAFGQTVQTTDPGRALVTGKWADIGKFKGPILRGLAARAPYFHNGSAATLDDAVTFYDTRFGIGLSAQEHKDLVAFLKTL